jgi:hypothetical protein
LIQGEAEIESWCVKYIYNFITIIVITIIVIVITIFLFKIWFTLCEFLFYCIPVLYILILQISK